MGGWFELFFVNTLGMPFNTGVIVYIILLVASFVWALWETYQSSHTKRENIAFLTAFALLGVPFVGYGWSAFFTGVVILAVLFFVLNMKKGKGKSSVTLIPTRLKNTALLCMLMLLIGFSSYALIVIRSTANPPMDQNSPEDIFTLGNYLSRQQYGQYPLFYGQAYTSEPAIAEDGMHYEFKQGAPIYEPKEKESADEKDSYYLVRRQATQVFQQNMFFPECGTRDTPICMSRGWEAYRVAPSMASRCRLSGRTSNSSSPISATSCTGATSCGTSQDVRMISRDTTSASMATGSRASIGSTTTSSAWATRISCPTRSKENKGHNVFYCMPLLLGLLGLFWQAFRGKRGIQQFWTVFFLFFMTGLAIVIYLNQTPGQPRERDYAYAGSFYAYAIWCGMGVAAMYEWLKNCVSVRSALPPWSRP